MHLTGHTILVTGGTSGIGRALAEALHARGNAVIVAGRRQALLDAVTAANPGMRGMRVDVADAAELDAFAARVREEVPELDVLLNNAGISRAEDLTDGGAHLADARAIIGTNVVAVLQLTAALLPALLRRPRAAVVTTTSGLAFLPLADYPTYCASKAFLHSWLQSLRAQLRGTPVEVLELVPPYVATELTGPAQANDPRAVPLADYVAEVMRLLEDPAPPRGEILVEAARALRFAERDGTYDAIFAERSRRPLHPR